MTFRDSNQAHHEREKAALRDKLAAEQAENDRLEQEVRNLRLQRSKPLQAVEDSPEFQEDLRRMGVRPGTTGRGFSGQSTLVTSIIDVVLFIPRLLFQTIVGICQLFAGFFSSVPFQAWIIGGILVLALGMCVYHEFYDPRDGYITGKDYHPPYTTTSCDSKGHCSTTYHPARWTVDINFQGSGATWEVSHREYDNLSHGEWYCARDFLHDAPCVRNRPADQ